MAKSKWQKSDEKKKLKEDIENGLVTARMPAVDVYNMREGIYHQYGIDRFKTNLKNLILALEKVKKSKWRKSDEKKKLKEDIENGLVTDRMAAVEVYNMHEGMYHKYDIDRFKTNLKNLLLAIKKAKDLAADADKILSKTLEGKLEAYNSPTKTWQWSEARKSSKAEITSGEATGKKPKEIFESKPEYQAYTLKRFRDNFNKEKYKLNGGTSAYWQTLKDKRR